MSSKKDFLPSSSPISSICAIEIEAIVLLFMMSCYKPSFQECITIVVLKIELRGTSRRIVYFKYKKRWHSASPGRVVLELPSPSPRVCTDRRTDIRWRQNQNFSDQQVTKFAYPWCSASSANNKNSAISHCLYEDYLFTLASCTCLSVLSVNTWKHC